MRSLQLALSISLLSSAALAETPDPQTLRARDHMSAAMASYDEGRYDDAVREMEAAYRLKPVPDLQYNLAQCYERLNRLGDAVKAYQAYLDGKREADDRSVVQARIKALDERIAASASQPSSTLAAPLPPTEKVVFKTIVVYRETPPRPGRGARWAGVGLGVLALAAVASSVTFGVLAARNSDIVSRDASTTSPMMFDGAAAAAQDAARQDVVLTWVSAGVGVAAVVGAVGLFVLGSRIDREAPALTLAPSVGRAGGGLVIAGTF